MWCQLRYVDLEFAHRLGLWLDALPRDRWTFERRNTGPGQYPRGIRFYHEEDAIEFRLRFGTGIV